MVEFSRDERGSGPLVRYLVRMDHVLLTCSFVGQLDHLYFLAVMIIAARNISVEVLCSHSSSFLPDIYVGAKLLGYRVTLCLTF